MKARNNQSEILRLQYRMTARRTWAGAWCAVNGACMGCSLQKDICCCPAPRLRLQLYTDAWMSCQCVWETRGRTKPHTHTHTLAQQEEACALTHIHTCYRQWLSAWEWKHKFKKEKKKKRFMAAAFGHRNVRRNAWCYLCVDALLRYTHNR